MKTIKEGTNGRMSHIHGLEGQGILLKWTYYLKAIYRVNVIPIKISMEFSQKWKTKL